MSDYIVTALSAGTLIACCFVAYYCHQVKRAAERNYEATVELQTRLQEAADAASWTPQEIERLFGEDRPSG